MPLTGASTFHHVDPDRLCLGCLQPSTGGGECASCGFDERAAQASPLYLPPRHVLHGQYLLGRVLGQGGFGITYLAWDLNLEIATAIKEFLPTEFASRASGQLRVTPYGEDGSAHFHGGLDAFEAEAKALARCAHVPGVVDVLNYYRENGTGYIVMHYLRGRTMREHLLAQPGPLPFESALEILRPVLAALQEVHRLGLVHRDVSPDNIYVCDSGRVCLLDFGAARNAVREHSKSLSVQFKAGYTPEEQYRRLGRQGPWTDVYASAATLYRAVTGVVPPAALDRLQQDGLRSPGSLGISMARGAERALMRGLAVRSEQRYQTVDDFLHDLTPESGLPMQRISNAAPQTGGAPTAATLARGSLDALAAAGRWLGATTTMAARVVTLRLQSAVSARAPASSERAIREQLAALWPATLVSATLRDPTIPGDADTDHQDVYARDETREVGFDVVLQNNYAGIRSLRGALGIAYVDPSGRTVRDGGPASPYTISQPVDDLVDRASITGAWGPGEAGGFAPGGWRIDFWFDGRKIGERRFIVSA